MHWPACRLQAQCVCLVSRAEKLKNANKAGTLSALGLQGS